MGIAQVLETGERVRTVAREMSVIAQDPSVLDASGNILMSKIRVPAEVVQPGPIGYRQHSFMAILALRNSFNDIYCRNFSGARIAQMC